MLPPASRRLRFHLPLPTTAMVKIDGGSSRSGLPSMRPSMLQVWKGGQVHTQPRSTFVLLSATIEGRGLSTNYRGITGVISHKPTFLFWAPDLFWGPEEAPLPGARRCASSARQKELFLGARKSSLWAAEKTFSGAQKKPGWRPEDALLLSPRRRASSGPQKNSGAEKKGLRHAPGTLPGPVSLIYWYPHVAKSL